MTNSMLLIFWLLISGMWQSTNPQSSAMLQLDLHYGDLKATQVLTATTTVGNSSNSWTKILQGASPVFRIPDTNDVYTIHITAPPQEDAVAIDFTANVPIETSFTGVSKVTVNNQQVKIIFNPAGSGGALIRTSSASF